jgi:hypothetical protein
MALLDWAFCMIISHGMNIKFALISIGFYIVEHKLICNKWEQILECIRLIE